VVVVVVVVVLLLLLLGLERVAQGDGDVLCRVLFGFCLSGEERIVGGGPSDGGGGRASERADCFFTLSEVPA
jgi:hypothetical protein